MSIYLRIESCGACTPSGIWVVNSVYNWGGASARDAANPVKAVKACDTSENEEYLILGSS